MKTITFIPIRGGISLLRSKKSSRFAANLRYVGIEALRHALLLMKLLSQSTSREKYTSFEIDDLDDWQVIDAEECQHYYEMQYE